MEPETGKTPSQQNNSCSSSSSMSSASSSSSSNSSSPSSNSSSSPSSSLSSASSSSSSSSSTASSSTSSTSGSSSSSSNVTAFLSKLWRLVNDHSSNELISWSSSGCSFVISNQIQFAKDLLPLYFKHSNMASFIRQLNMYGFRKIPIVGSNGNVTDQRTDVAQFYHVNFMRGQEQRLVCIKRKNNSCKTHNLIVNGTFCDEVRSILSDVKSIRDGQNSSESILSALQVDNKSLFRDVAILRTQHHKQRRVIEKLIQFLMSLIQNRNNIVTKKRKVRLMINTSVMDQVVAGNFNNGNGGGSSSSVDGEGLNGGAIIGCGGSSLDGCNGNGSVGQTSPMDTSGCLDGVGISIGMSSVASASSIGGDGGSVPMSPQEVSVILARSSSAGSVAGNGPSPMLGSPHGLNHNFVQTNLCQSAILDQVSSADGGTCTSEIMATGTSAGTLAAAAVAAANVGLVGGRSSAAGSLHLNASEISVVAAAGQLLRNSSHQQQQASAEDIKYQNHHHHHQQQHQSQHQQQSQHSPRNGYLSVLTGSGLQPTALANFTAQQQQQHLAVTGNRSTSQAMVSTADGVGPSQQLHSPGICSGNSENINSQQQQHQGRGSNNINSNQSNPANGSNQQSANGYQQQHQRNHPHSFPMHSFMNGNGRNGNQQQQDGTLGSNRVGGGGQDGGGNGQGNGNGNSGGGNGRLSSDSCHPVTQWTANSIYNIMNDHVGLGGIHGMGNVFSDLRTGQSCLGALDTVDQNVVLGLNGGGGSSSGGNLHQHQQNQHHQLQNQHHQQHQQQHHQQHQQHQQQQQQQQHHLHQHQSCFYS